MLTYKVVERQNALTKQLQYYAQVSPVTPVTLDQIVELIEKRSTVTSADVKAVLDALQFEVRNALVDGKSVRLGDLGSFRPTLSSRSALSADAFLPANIKGVRVRYVPSARRWEQVAAPADERGEAIALGGGAGYALGDTAALCLGGVDKDIFLAALRREQRLAQARATGDDSLAATLQAAGRDYMTHEPAWYRFNRRVLRYSAAADRWTTVDRADQAARAGAALTGKGTTFYYLGGELKPGIRTPDLWRGQYR